MIYKGYIQDYHYPRSDAVRRILNEITITVAKGNSELNTTFKIQGHMEDRPNLGISELGILGELKKHGYPSNRVTVKKTKKGGFQNEHPCWDINCKVNIFPKLNEEASESEGDNDNDD